MVEQSTGRFVIQIRSVGFKDRANTVGHRAARCETPLISCFFLFVSVLLVTCRAEEKVADEPKEVKEELVLLEVESDADQGKPKRQTEEGRALGATQHFFGSAPGHYVLRTSPKDAAVEVTT